MNPVNLVVLTEKKKEYIVYSLICWGVPFVTVGICVTLQFTKIGNVAYGKFTGNLRIRICTRVEAQALFCLTQVAAISWCT